VRTTLFQPTKVWLWCVGWLPTAEGALKKDLPTLRTLPPPLPQLSGTTGRAAAANEVNDDPMDAQNGAEGALVVVSITHLGLQACQHCAALLLPGLCLISCCQHLGPLAGLTLQVAAQAVNIPAGGWGEGAGAGQAQGFFGGRGQGCQSNILHKRPWYKGSRKGLHLAVKRWGWGYPCNAGG